MAVEVSDRSWLLTFRGGERTRKTSVAPKDATKLVEVVVKMRKRFGPPADAKVLSCYEAGLDGFWIHRFWRRSGWRTSSFTLRASRSTGAFGEHARLTMKNALRRIHA